MIEFLYFWRDKAALFGLASGALLAISGGYERYLAPPVDFFRRQL